MGGIANSFQLVESIVQDKYQILRFPLPRNSASCLPDGDNLMPGGGWRRGRSGIQMRVCASVRKRGGARGSGTGRNLGDLGARAVAQFFGEEIPGENGIKGHQEPSCS